jgi:two-component system chemotaxis response regulator CheB
MLNVLVIDDSAVVRQVAKAILEATGGFAVDVAADPLIAMKKMEKRRPDVILLDIEMPRMDGLTFLRKLMSEDPIPVVVCSAVAGRGTETALRALEEGAVEIVTKPRAAVHEYFNESTELLTDAIRAAAHAKCRRRLALAPPAPRSAGIPAGRSAGFQPARKLVAIGASTGGTEALREILEALPADGPGIVIVQHMPEVFTAAFANRLNQTCRMEVKEAAEGDVITAGRALIAPGSHHVHVVREGGEYRIRLSDGPLVSRHRPSVDVLFRSVAESAGPHALGLILTGMGDDGAAGLLAMRQAGATTLAQDEATSIVFGMPKAAIGRGAVDMVHPLPRLAAAILSRSMVG